MRILILNSDQASTLALRNYFISQGDQVRDTDNLVEARALLKREPPGLVLVDLHLPGNGWLELLGEIKRQQPPVKLIITNQIPDIRREMQAKEQGARVFLRAPFTAAWIERALKKLDLEAQGVASISEALPPVRVPIRLKITVPYALLALVFAFAAFYLGSRFILESIEAHFLSQLLDTGVLAADWMVREEDRLLESLRYLANTQGVSVAITDGDSQRLQEIALPLAFNFQEEAIEILNLDGVSLLSLWHPEGDEAGFYKTQTGDAGLIGVDFVQNVLHGKSDAQGDKFAGLIRRPFGDYFYIAGPIFDPQGQLVGVVLIGKSLATMARQIREDTLAQVTLYAPDGTILTSTVLVPEDLPSLEAGLMREVLLRQQKDSVVRHLQIASARYSEVLGAWEARGGQDLGVIGVSLSQNYVLQPSAVFRFQAFFVVAGTFCGVILLGMYVSRQVTKPLSSIVHASQRIAQGDLAVKVPVKGDDEVTVLAHAFNHMISRLQEGFIYRDLLGRAVSPEVREAMRKSFASGDLRLEGQSAFATVLMSDIRGFTGLSEKAAPATVLTWLNEYFGELVPVITNHGGVVDKFEGDAMLAFFGLLPAPLPPQESAYQACQAAVEMMAAVEQLNARRLQREEPPFITGVGIHSGMLTAGSLGTADRLNFTIIGDTVNTTERIQDISRGFGESGVVISESTLSDLQIRRDQFRIEPLGEQAFKGKTEQLWLYRLWRNTES